MSFSMNSNSHAILIVEEFYGGLNKVIKSTVDQIHTVKQIMKNCYSYKYSNKSY